MITDKFAQRPFATIPQLLKAVKKGKKIKILHQRLCQEEDAPDDSRDYILLSKDNGDNTQAWTENQILISDSNEDQATGQQQLERKRSTQ